MASNVDHHTFRCKTRGLLHSAVSAAVAVVFSIPFMSRLPLTDVVGRRSVEVNVAELDASKANENVRKFPAKLHARKVAKELGTDTGLIFLPGQLESTWEDSDQGPPFRQRRYFYYLTGADFPGCSVTYDIAADKLTLWIPFTPPATVLWFGNTPSPENCLARSDVHDVKYVGELPGYLSARLATVKTLYALRPSQLPKFDGFEQMKPSLRIDVASLQPAMDEARLIKSEYEIAMIRRANEISSAAHKKVASLMYGMKNECEVEAAFISACTAANAHAQAYPVIAGSGANASTLHYSANNENLAGRQLMVLDAGAEWSCYASEMTRTLPIGPRYKLSSETKAIYELVHRMQNECIDRIKPGVVFRDLQLHATLIAVQGLLDLGILRGGTAEEIFKNGTGAAFFPHGLGHHVGLDVHDVLSRDLLRPAGEGMWGKRRPIGPQSVRAMIKQAARDAAHNAAATANPSDSSSTPSSNSSNSNSSNASQRAPSPANSSPTQTAAPPLPPRSSPPTSPKSTPPKSASPPPIRIIASSPPPQLHQQSRTGSIGNGNAGNGKKKATVTNPTSTSTSNNKRAHHSTLQPNMIVTVEPGIYFCRPYIEAYFLRREEHARYMDAAALERFWAVGGVRVEDCVLVTESGHENLTTAPKGAELLRLMGY
ncbi:metallopeptidase family M24-domain-containing protein [Hypoxylon fragiforme]|uniref:metallopeptidase family M24-domain-containing protein n=1 Tax=Hypoxylon fragiforme TaxID=63214 RepID=UPI0020C64079|nr:metallopeptidase family M24-domain-containing protein [Hypoxylon fragiforme]KAI2612475.1 metallopeptidase family M24-domain-containing protein [Hypoxylon fragiforme]